MIKKPPVKRHLLSAVFEKIAQGEPELLGKYLDCYKAVDDKGRYLPYDEYRHRVLRGLDVDMAWSLTKGSRVSQYKKLLPLGDNSELCNFILTPIIQKAISHTDRNATTGTLEWMSGKIGEENHFKYLLNDLIE
ncbi:MAG: hypothetical protein ACRC9E_11685, partial [Plesiomonas shigelloides]